MVTAQDLLKKYVKDPANLLHARETQVILEALAEYFKEDPKLWGETGLLHDLDWELIDNDFEKHGFITLKILEKEGFNLTDEQKHAILSHNENYTKIKRESVFDYALSSGESVTGLIYAYSLMRPEKLSGMKIKSLNKKFKDKSFAANVNRDFIADIEKTGLLKNDFFEIAIKAMQNIKNELFS
jgi:hypothetical protein